MRTIKFRYTCTNRDSAEIKYVYLTLEDIENGGFAQVLGTWPHVLIHKDEWTGLLDKNGKDVFEGDILSNGDSDMEVVWNQGAWTLNGLENLITDKVDHTKFLEVIGNKYEGTKR